MRPERWQQLKDVFDRALEQDPARRATFLNEACAGDSALRAEVESLLASHQEADDFLERPAADALAGLPEDDPADRLLGTTLGSYKVTKKLGRGGMGIVYLAEDTRLGRPVAIKALAPEYTQDDQHRERLRREARVAAAFAHPAIATVFALEEHAGNLYLISEYVRGCTLLEEMERGPLSLEILLETGLAIAQALAAAHEQGIIHRDLKPENVMRTPDGAVKILDFGLARFQFPRPDDKGFVSRLTGAGAFLGTPAYSSPEQLLGLEVDFRTDIFSYGIMLYELASGTHPFWAKDSVTTIARILEAEPVNLRELRPLIPPGLDRIVRRCLQKTPAQRYSATREIAADLEQVKIKIQERPAIQPQEEVRSAILARSTRLHPLWWWQFHQAWVGLMYYLMLYPMWKLRAWIPGGWGSLLFFLSVAAVGVAANLRIHLWFTSAFYPGELSEQRRSVSRWIRFADVFFVSLLLAGAIAVHGDHAAVATLLIAVAIGSLGAFLLIEPTTTRAAFEAGAKANLPGHQRM